MFWTQKNENVLKSSENKLLLDYFNLGEEDKYLRCWIPSQFRWDDGKQKSESLSIEIQQMVINMTLALY